MKSKYGPGGEFEPDWYVLSIDRLGIQDLKDFFRAPHDACGHGHGHGHAESMPQPIVPPMSPAEGYLVPAEEVPMVKPAWRNIQKRKNKRQQQEAFTESMMGLAPNGQNSWASWPGELHTTSR
jgi:hypothetical protein